MHPLLWLQRLFMPPSDPDAPGLEEESQFVFGQHLRVVLAIVVCILSAGVIWWIMAS